MQRCLDGMYLRVMSEAHRCQVLVAGAKRFVTAALLSLAVLALAVLAMPALAQQPVPPLRGAVNDLTHTLSAAQAGELDSRLKAFAQQRGSQIAVLIVPTTQPEAIEQFSIRVAEAWTIGRAGKDDGVILVVAKNDRTLRIEVGYGLEGAIPDAIGKRIIEEIIVPHFRDGDFSGGITQGVASIMKLIEGEKLPAPGPRGAASPTGGMDLQMILVLLVGLTVVNGLLGRVLGKFGGAAVGSGIAGVIVWAVIGSVAAAIVIALIGFVFSLFAGSSHGRFRGGGLGGGGFGGGGFGGGGGGFGGGGASGRW